MSDSLSLFKINTTVAQLMEMRDELQEQGALPDEFAALDSEIARYLNEQLPAKVDGIIGFMRRDEAVAEAAEAEAKRLTDIAKARRARVQRLSDYCLFAMREAGQKRLEGATGGALKIQQNGGTVPVVVDQLALLPDEYVVYQGTISGEAWWFLKGYMGPEHWGKWSGREDVQMELKPALGRIRAALEKKCETCGGSGKVRGPSQTFDELICESCGGSGRAGVPGAHLGEKGEHLRWR